MKLGIYGGSFSPPHMGHFKSALHFYDSCGLDRLLIMPAGIPPHKTAPHVVSGDLRQRMLQAAFAPQKIGERSIEISDHELKREGKSYTYLTLEHFKKEDVELFLLVGSDMFLTLDSWNRPDIIFSLATIVLNPREQDAPIKAFEEKKRLYVEKYGARVIFSDFEPLEISSSAIRQELARGNDPASLDPEVLAFIKEQKLYHSSCSPQKIKEDLKKTLSEKRVAHILSVEREVLRMAGLFGLDKEETLDLQIAALLHDVTHEKTTEEQQALFALYGLPFTFDDAHSPAVVHQTTGALLALDLYGVSPRCAKAIACHTTGKEDMSLLDKLLCLADFIEEQRQYPACIELRSYFYAAFPSSPTAALAHLDNCMMRYLENTVSHLEEKGAFIHPQTLAARNFLKNKAGKSCKE